VRLVLVESPYTSPKGRLECVRYALWCMYDSLSRGEAPMASHLLYTQALPEDQAGRAMGLECRDAWSRQTTLVAQYTDLGLTPGMVRDVDSTNKVEQRKLEGALRDAWLIGTWPPGSVRLAVL
jgi:hypothetical protein